MPTNRRPIFICVLAFVGALSLGARCQTLPKIQIDTPVHGTFTTAPTVNVTGRITGSLSRVADLFVDGTSVLPLGPAGEFAAAVTLDTALIFNPILVELQQTNDNISRKRVTVIAGQSISDGAYSPMGIALRLNDSVLDEIEPLVETLAASSLDIEALLLANNPVASMLVCIIPNPFGGCIAGVTVVVDVTSASFSSFSLDIDSQTNFAEGDIRVNNLRVDYDTDGIDCQGRITSTTTDILGDYALQPDAVDPSNIDVNLISPIDVVFSGFNNQFTGGLCDFPVIGDILQLIIGNVQPLVENGFESGLSDPDGPGPADSPIADGIETALAGIELSGPIGQAIGVDLDTPLFDVFEDTIGITLDSDARITASMPDPAAVDLLASYHVPEAFPSFGANAPGGDPYDMALCISTSAFNQLLKGEIESGLLITSITDIPQLACSPLTAGCLAFIPGFDLLDPATPLRIDIKPTLGAIVTGEDGPGGEIAELRISDLIASLVEETQGTTLLEFAVDARIGLDIGFDAGVLSFDLGTLQSQDIDVAILVNLPGTNEVGLVNLLTFLLPDLLSSLASSLGTFPLPDFLGLSLNLVEVSKNGQFMSLFLNLTPVP